MTIQTVLPEMLSTTTLKVPCPECYGLGKVHYSCCGDDVYGTVAEDYDLCPSCKEHLPGRTVCENCSGTGKINK